MFKKLIIIIVLGILIFEQAGFAVVLNSVLDAETKVKFGELQKDEVWEGRIFLIGDVIVPFGRKLVIKPGTQLIFDERDILEGGKHKDQCELIAYGKIEAEASSKNPIKMISVLGLNANKVLELDQSVRVIRFSPYKIDTDSLKKEFRGFKHQYIIVWGIIYGMWIFARNI